jgi:hypothetical protein
MKNSNSQIFRRVVAAMDMVVLVRLSACGGGNDIGSGGTRNTSVTPHINDQHSRRPPLRASVASLLTVLRLAIRTPAL